MSGLRRLLTVTADAHLNALACNRYKGVPGSKDLYALKAGRVVPGNSRSDTACEGRTAFGSQVASVDMSRRLYRGAEVRRTNLSEAFTLEHFNAMHGGRATLLFAITPKGQLEVFSVEALLEPGRRGGR